MYLCIYSYRLRYTVYTFQQNQIFSGFWMSSYAFSPSFLFLRSLNLFQLSFSVYTLWIYPKESSSEGSRSDPGSTEPPADVTLKHRTRRTTCFSLFSISFYFRQEILQTAGWCQHMELPRGAHFCSTLESPT